MWIAWFLVTWITFMSLLVLLMVHENKEDARLLAQINDTLQSTLDVYPEEVGADEWARGWQDQPVSSTGVETEKVLTWVG